MASSKAYHPLARIATAFLFPQLFLTNSWEKIIISPFDIEYRYFDLNIGKGACSQDYFVLRGPFPVDDDGEILDDRRQLRQSIGRAVAEARREQGMTQKQLAERALVDQAVVSRVERGRANITSDLLADVACALGMCVEVTLAPAAVYNGEPDEGRSGL